jgi:hypothetical protein
MTITLTIEPKHLLDDEALDRISLRELIVIARSHAASDLAKVNAKDTTTPAPDEEEAITWEDAEWQ